ncbi:MAG: hypothetical protein CMH22_05710 [Methylophaga sp.]|nr:hypothetical protein [Methylophaga sp.]|tara:strand:+ start:96304 stop:97023 length:720 start_codon:yes stop_codon:yes gene_type:complete
MKKYRHIPTGKVFEVLTLNKEGLVGLSSEDGWEIPLWVVHNSKDWEEVVDRDYEVLNYYMHTPQGISNGVPFRVVTKVKRLSDSVCFCVSDKVQQPNCKTNTFTISGFKLDCNGEQMLALGGNGGISINKIEHFRECLFTTEDGVDVFEGNSCWVVSKEYNYQIANYKINNIDVFYIPAKNWYFSTKKAAEEYVLYNKPCLSLNDVMSQTSWQAHGKQYNFTWQEKLKKLVKSKIDDKH